MMVDSIRVNSAQELLNCLKKSVCFEIAPCRTGQWKSAPTSKATKFFRQSSNSYIVLVQAKHFISHVIFSRYYVVYREDSKIKPYEQKGKRYR